ncbi:hypothetical protein A6D6_01739 [Alcanivorax xiamenensis]|uniref:MAPEG family protein n=1 Tax=Alcanivorax xiamenensis TaxID=1177156 RepID=A0ABQ6Y9T9_9GAMM|nr:MULTISPECIES: MAPEG family protein [Alcanivorax]KAF0806159.1 hypothetical protein A6D6_01739 [Alcanivorax xiamenensis]
MTLDTSALLYLLGFGSWALFLLFALVAGRGLQVMSGRRRADAFPPYHYEPAEFLSRLSRAYQNTLELLGVVIVIAGAAMVVGNDLAGRLLPWILAARIGQSLVHLLGVNHWLVQIRFAFLLVQMVLLAWLAVDTFPILCDLIKP